MEKIKTAEEYLKEVNSFTTRERFYEIGKQMQLDMLEYAVNKCTENARTMDDPNSYCGNTGSEYPPDIIVSKQSILKTIDEIKKELE